VRVPADALRAFSARSQLVLIDAKPAVRKQILRELQIMHDCSSDHIVSFYGAFLADPHICICMEHMDRGCASVRWFLTPKRRLMLIAVPSPFFPSPRSLDNIYREHGALAVPIVGAIARCVLQGLTYLYDAHRIIHRGSSPLRLLLSWKAGTDKRFTLPRQTSNQATSSSTRRAKSSSATLASRASSSTRSPTRSLARAHT
jgi:serine/threonine protein kinase